MRSSGEHWKGLFVLTALSLGQSPPAAKLVTSDIANFWKAYDAAPPDHREEAFQKLYFDPGSDGLKDFLKLRIQSAKVLAETVDRRYPKFYATVRPYTLTVDQQMPAIRTYLERFRELYPQAHFPPVYFVIGRVSSGGTTSSNGLLIGTEINSLGPAVDTSEINPSFRRAMGTADHLPLIVIHELTHTQATSSTKSVLPNLLTQSIGEGAADFMTELVANDSINAYARDWAGAHREELFKRFARDLAEKPDDASHWLYNYDSVKDEPADLGYWIGAEICRSYYTRAKDKAAAVREIVTLVHVAEIVHGSQYSYLLDPAR